MLLQIVGSICVWALVSTASATLNHDHDVRLPTGTKEHGTSTPNRSSSMRQSHRSDTSTIRPRYVSCLGWDISEKPTDSTPYTPALHVHFNPLEPSLDTGARFTTAPPMDVSMRPPAGSAADPLTAANGVSTDTGMRHGDVFSALLRERNWDREDIAGYFASLLVLLTFCTRQMWTLRWAAIGSNIAFIIYGYLAVLAPVFLLHMILLPINVIRVLQLSRQGR